MAFVQGFLASITLDSTDITLFTADVSLDRSKTVLNKATMNGTGFMASIPGLQSGTLSINGHVDQANLNALETTWAKGTTVTFAFEVNEGLSTDGSYAGSVTCSGLSVDTSAEGNWAFSLSGDLSGAVTYTPSSP
jgi:hypothetical protein